MKAQVFPDQFPAWFGVPLATEGEAAVLVFPRIEPGAHPAAAWLAEAVREQRDDLDVAGRPTGDFLLVRHPSTWGYGKASWEITSAATTSASTAISGSR